MWSITVLSQLLLTCHPTGDGILRFGFPLPAHKLERGLRAVGPPGLRLQWRRLQRRPDRRSGRTWVELCLTGATGRLRIYAGGAPAADPAAGPLVTREIELHKAEGRRAEQVRWRWHDGCVDEIERLHFEASQEYQGERFAVGECSISGMVAARFTAAGIKARDWRRAGVLPPGGGRHRALRRRLCELVAELEELQGLRDRGDYRRSGGVLTNLEFDTSLALARLGLAQADPRLLAKALRSALHSAGHDRDPRTGLLHRHGRDHHDGPAEPGHTWLTGILLLGCLAADEHLIRTAESIAHGLAGHPSQGDPERKSDRVRDVGWPLLEMENWLRFADDPLVERATRSLVAHLLRRWDGRHQVFRFGEGRSRGGTYEETAWVVGGSLVPGLRAYAQRTGDRRVGRLVAEWERQLSDLIRNGKPGLPLRFFLAAGKVVGAVRVEGAASGFLLLEGLSDAARRRCLDRKMVRKALCEVPAYGDEDLATNFTIVGRCTWIYR